MKVQPKMSLPKTICLSTVLALSCLQMGFAKETMTPNKTKAPFKVLFSNDTTNCTSCIQPGQTKLQHFSPEILKGTVDETIGIGIDVHMLQPGLGWVPWWPSKVCPNAIQWYQDLIDQSSEEGRYPSSYDRYLLGGGDIVDVFVKRCREKGITPFISYRLNDTHGRRTKKEPGWSGDIMGQFYFEHPEYRIGPNSIDSYKRVQNWAIPEVRDYKFALMNEIIENYDIDGFELDFLRYYSLFQLDKTTPEQRKEIMTNFIARVRKALDDNSKPGEHKWLCVRISSHADTHDALGIDVQKFVEAGVDMINLSGSYFTEHQTDLGKIVKLIPDTPVYLEMTHTIMTGQSLDRTKYDSFTFRRTTPNQFYTAAHLAYAQGAAGVSAFNFVYYREHGVPGRGPFHDPPFHIFNHIGDKEWVAKQDQHYILCAVWNKPRSATQQLPKYFDKGRTHTFTMFMAEPTGGWKQDGKLRIECDKLLGNSKWSVTFNGVKLQETSDRTEPYPNPYPNLLGEEGQYRAFVLPCDIVKNGDNEIEVTMTDGKKKHKIVFMDIALKAGH